MHLQFLNKGKPFCELEPVAGGPTGYLIGKGDGTANPDVRLPDIPGISRSHATIRLADGVLYLTDSSTNGTFLNNRRLQKGAPARVAAGDVLHFGASDIQALVLRQPTAARPAAAGPKTTDLAKLLEAKEEVIVGRAPECDLVVGSTHASRRHCLVYKKGSAVYVKDLDSRNGTYVNGARIKTAVVFKEGDELLAGTSRITLAGKAASIEAETAIRLSGLQKRFANGRQGFYPVSFSVPAGGMMGIMGPSGCGKSTLLNTLTATLRPTGGTILLHGLDLATHQSYLKHYIGYVPQYDIAHKDLTVYECLRYTAYLRLERPEESAVDARILEILAQLNIPETRHQRIASLSGGQRKRVCIAIELINEPLLLFLDEPTSPLDPQSAEELMEILNRLAAAGTTIVTVTHKPDDLAYLDTVLFLGKGGYPLYCGSATQHLQHFKAENAIGIYKFLNQPESPAFQAMYEAQQRAGSAAISSTAPAGHAMKGRSFSTYSQLWWLTRRNFAVKLNDRTNTTILLVQAPVIALLVCLIFPSINLSVLFLMSLSAVWLGTNNASREVVAEADIYRRERLFNLGILPYIHSKLVVFMVLAGVQAALFTTVLAVRYGGTEAPLEQPVAVFAWMFFLTLVSTILGLVVSAVSRTTEQVISVIPLILIPQILLAGTLARVQSVGVEFLSYGTLSRWGTEGFTRLQKSVFDSAVSPVAFSSGKMLTRQFHKIYQEKEVFGSLTATLRLDVIAVSLTALVLYAVLYAAMKRKDGLEG